MKLFCEGYSFAEYQFDDFAEHGFCDRAFASASSVAGMVVAIYGVNENSFSAKQVDPLVPGEMKNAANALLLNLDAKRVTGFSPGLVNGHKSSLVEGVIDFVSVLW